MFSYLSRNPALPGKRYKVILFKGISPAVAGVVFFDCQVPMYYLEFLQTRYDF